MSWFYICSYSKNVSSGHSSRTNTQCQTRYFLLAPINYVLRLRIKQNQQSPVRRSLRYQLDWYYHITWQQKTRDLRGLFEINELGTLTRPTPQRSKSGKVLNGVSQLSELVFKINPNFLVTCNSLGVEWTFVFLKFSFFATKGKYKDI